MHCWKPLFIRTKKKTGQCITIKPLSACYDISGDKLRYKASYNSAYIAADGHELLLKRFG